MARTGRRLFVLFRIGEQAKKIEELLIKHALRVLDSFRERLCANRLDGLFCQARKHGVGFFCVIAQEHGNKAARALDRQRGRKLFALEFLVKLVNDGVLGQRAERYGEVAEHLARSISCHFR